MTVDIALDPTTGDKADPLAGFRLIEGTPAISQRLEVRLRIQRGTWFLDALNELGPAWFDGIFGGSGTGRLGAESELRRVILGTPGIAEFTVPLSLKITDRAARRLGVTATVSTDDGDTIALEEVLP